MNQELKRVPRSKLPHIGMAAASGDLKAVREVLEPTAFEFNRDVVYQLCGLVVETYSKGMKGFAKSEADAYFAPRLHAAIRIPRRLAADPGIWCWLASDVCRTYSEARWPWQMGDNTWRYNSRDLLRNGIARLWWAAEMIRSGPDYTLVAAALGRVRRYEFVGELMYSWHRECARAFARVTSQHSEDGDQLSPRFNSYLATQSLEQFETDFSTDQEACWDAKWAKQSVSLSSLEVLDSELVGPSKGLARTEVEEPLVAWLEELRERITILS